MRKLLLELSTLVANVASNVNEDSSVRVPPLRFLLDRIHVPAYSLILTAVHHVLIEVRGGLWMFHEPEEGRQWGLVGDLMGCIGVVCDILVFGLQKEVWQFLKHGPHGVEPTTVAC